MTKTESTFSMVQTDLFLFYFGAKVQSIFAINPGSSLLEILNDFRKEAELKGILIDKILPEVIYQELSLELY
jgi:hypothetical protein